MGTIKPPPQAKLIAAIMVSTSDLFTEAKHALERCFGPIDLESDMYSFTFTSYYEEEMGERLEKQIVSFDRLIEKDTLSSSKIQSNQIEARFAFRDGDTIRRRVNIDPGYVNDSKLVLASTKNFSHRVYLGDGIFAEVTLRYLRTGGYQPLEWTYPDYRTDEIRIFLEKVRNRYMEQVRSVEWQN
jgi:hypothetical protein